MSAGLALSVRVAEEIRAVMGRQSISKSELARRMEVTDVWIGRRLRGIAPIDLNDLERIAGALNVDVADLLPRRAGTTLQQSRGAVRPPNRAPDGVPGGGRTSRTRPPGGPAVPSQRVMIR